MSFTPSIDVYDIDYYCFLSQCMTFSLEKYLQGNLDHIPKGVACDAKEFLFMVQSGIELERNQTIPKNPLAAIHCLLIAKKYGLVPWGTNSQERENIIWYQEKIDELSKEKIHLLIESEREKTENLKNFFSKLAIAAISRGYEKRLGECGCYIDD